MKTKANKQNKNKVQQTLHTSFSFFSRQYVKKELKDTSPASEKNTGAVTYRLVILWGVKLYRKQTTFQIFIPMILQIIETC